MKPINTTLFIGHQALEQTFLNSLKNGTMHHAYMLSGPRGVGKETFAYRCARFLFHYGLDIPDVDSLDLPSDSTVPSRMESGGLTDLKVIEKEEGKTEISVESVKSLNQFLGLTAAENSYRVVIINSIDELNRNSGNAILKMLEEPPKNTIFFLISHQKSGVLPTIRSRCNELLFSPLSDDEMNEALSYYAPEMSNLNRGRIMAVAQGSLGQALSIADGSDLLNDLDMVQADLKKGNDKTLMPFVKKVVAAEALDTVVSILLGQVKDQDLYVDILELVRQTQSLKLDKESVLLIILKKVNN